jgi:hypothetical protein
VTNWLTALVSLAGSGAGAAILIVHGPEAVVTPESVSVTPGVAPVRVFVADVPGAPSIV